MKIQPYHVVPALRHYAALAPEQARTLNILADEIEAAPRMSRAMVAVALSQLGITHIPDETWSTPLPTVAAGAETLGADIDALSAAWKLTALHKLVAARRVAWSAAQVARALEKEFAQTQKRA